MLYKNKIVEALMMKHPVFKYKYLPCIIFFILSLSLAVKLNAKDDIPEQTGVMLKTLSELQRIDVHFEDYENLIRQIFTEKENLKQVRPQITEFFLSEENYAGKRWFLNELKNTSTSLTLDFMAELLTHNNSAYLTLMALQDMPDPEVNKLLMSSISRVPPEIQLGIVNVLGSRPDNNSVAFLAGFLYDVDLQLESAAISALGKTGTPQAVNILLEAISSVRPQNQLILMEALLAAAEQMNVDNPPDHAYELYHTILNANPPEIVALAAVKGMIYTTSGDPEEILKKNMLNAPDELRYQLIDLIKCLPDSYRSGKEFLQLPEISDEDKLRMITVLAERKDKSIRDEVLDLIQHDYPVYRKTAIRAFSGIAEAEDVPTLVKLAATGSKEEKELARKSLYGLQGNEIDAFILQKVYERDDALLTEYIKAIGERNIRNADTILIQTAKKSDNSEVRMESYKALAEIAGPDHIAEIIELLLETENKKERQQLERTIYQVAARFEGKGVATRTVVDHLYRTSGNDNISSLITVLGNIKNPDNVEDLIRFLHSEDKNVQLSAIRALSDWPNADPLNEFKKILRNTDDARVKVLCLRGYIQVVLNDTGLSGVKKVEELRFGLSNAGSEDEKKLIISALGKVPSIHSLSLLINEMAEPANIGPELEAAILNITPELMEEDRKNTLSELNRLANFTDNEKILKWIR